MSLNKLKKNGPGRNAAIFEKVGVEGLAKKYDVSLDEAWTYLEDKEIATRPAVVIDEGPVETTEVVAPKRGRGRPKAVIATELLEEFVANHLNLLQMSEVSGFSVPTLQKRMVEAGLSRSRGTKRTAEEIEQATTFVASQSS